MDSKCTALLYDIVTAATKLNFVVMVCLPTVLFVDVSTYGEHTLCTCEAVCKRIEHSESGDDIYNICARLV